MVRIPVRCLSCQSDQVTKRGKTAQGKQRYRCHNPVTGRQRVTSHNRGMHRFAFCLCMLALLSACSGKKVPVALPTASRPSASSSELEGLASYYAEPHHGRRTASGEVFDTYRAMTAAHRTLPFNTVVRVQNKSNGKEVEVRINDRGPFIDGRIIDLSLRAARALDMIRAGVVRVKLKIISQGTVPRRTASGMSLDTVQDGVHTTFVQ
jgi:peptidoglycan lytic transglycosylase